MKTTNSKFSILLSKIKRHEKSCHDIEGNNIDHNLSNVTLGSTSVTIKLKSDKLVTLYGNKIEYQEITILYSEIKNVEWITPDLDPILKARYKATKFDNLCIFYPGGRLDLEGIGQAVFPIMSFIGWVQTN